MSSFALVMCKFWVKTVPTLWKLKFLGVWWVVVSKFRLILEFSRVSSVWFGTGHRWLRVFVSGDGKNMAGCRWLWVVLDGRMMLHNLVMPLINWFSIFTFFIPIIFAPSAKLRCAVYKISNRALLGIAANGCQWLPIIHQ